MDNDKNNQLYEADEKTVEVEAEEVADEITKEVADEITEEAADEITDEVADEVTDEAASSIPDFLKPAIEKGSQLIEKADDYLYHAYTEPDEKSIMPVKKAYTILGICAAAALILGFAIIIFLGTYPYYTTGVRTKDFVREFNNICSDTDLLAMIPDYVDEDYQLPKASKLGKEPIYFLDGHIKMTVNTRFGKIVDLKIEGIDLPNYNERTHGFLSAGNSEYDGTYDHFKFFIVLGKASLALQECMSEATDISDASSSDIVSAAEVSGCGLTAKGHLQSSVFDACTYGYQLYYYSYYYRSNQINDGYMYVLLENKDYIDYDLLTCTMTFQPCIKKITELPEPLQNFVNLFNNSDKKTEDAADEASAVSSADTVVSGTVVSAS